MRLLSLAGLVVFCSLGVFAAEPSPPKKDAPAKPEITELEVQRLLAQLGSDEFLVREKAQERIESLGKEILPHLRKATNHPDPEVRTRIREWLPQLETTLLLQPKRVTLKMEEKPLKDIFDEITRQTGYQIQFWGKNQQEVYSVNVENVTFWKAMDTICRETGLMLQDGYSDARIRLSNQNGHAAFVTHDGMFRFMARSFHQSRTIDFGIVRPDSPPVTNETLSLNFSMYTEPKMPFLGMGQARVRAAYDNERNSMLIPQPGNPGFNDGPFGGPGQFGGYSRYSNKTFSMQTSVQLRRSSENAKTVKLIRGMIPVTLLSNSTEVTVTDKLLEAKGLEKEIGGKISMKITDVQAMPGGQYQVALNITMKDPGQDYSWTSSLYQRIKVLDEKGNQFSAYSTRWGGSGNNNVQLTFTYGRPGGKNVTKPTKLLFDHWETMQTEIPFEFHNLPLP